MTNIYTVDFNGNPDFMFSLHDVVKDNSLIIRVRIVFDRVDQLVHQASLSNF